MTASQHGLPPCEPEIFLQKVPCTCLSDFLLVCLTLSVILTPVILSNFDATLYFFVTTQLLFRMICITQFI